jgi:transcriptional regulator with XRE-family HTH domain
MTTMTEVRPARPARTAIRRPASGIAIDPAKLTWWRDRRALSRQDLSDRIALLYLDGHPDALPFTHRAASLTREDDDGLVVVRYWDPEFRGEQERSFRDDTEAHLFKLTADAALPSHRPVFSVPGPADRVCEHEGCGAPVAGGLTRDAIAKIENGERRPKARTLRALCAALSTPHETVLPEHLQPGGPPLALSPAAQDRQARKDYNTGMRDFADALGRPDLYRNSNNRVYYSKELREMYEAYLADTGAGTSMASAVA